MLRFHYQPGIAAQNQLLSAFALTAWCPLPPAAVWFGFTRAHQMSPEWNGLFYQLSRCQLSPRHPHTCKGRYTTLLMPHCEAVCISDWDWDGQEGHPSQDCRLTARQSRWRGNQKYPLRYAGFKEWWKNARSALYSLSLIDTQSGKDSRTVFYVGIEKEQRNTEAVEEPAVFLSSMVLQIKLNELPKADPWHLRWCFITTSHKNRQLKVMDSAESLQKYLTIKQNTKTIDKKIQIFWICCYVGIHKTKYKIITHKIRKILGNRTIMQCQSLNIVAVFISIYCDVGIWCCVIYALGHATNYHTNFLSYQ